MTEENKRNETAAVAKSGGGTASTPVEDMSLLSITDGENARGIPFVKFIDDVDAFANTFSPPASAEILIGAYSELHSKFKTFETSLTQKSKFVVLFVYIDLPFPLLWSALGMGSFPTRNDFVCPIKTYLFAWFGLIRIEQNYQQKLPDIEKSLSLIQNLQKKKDCGGTTMTRYNLADNVYGKAEVDCSVGIVNLWLGANVMLEYTYEEAIEFLSQNEETAKTEFKTVKEDLAFVRDQIVTSEVSMTRIFNWDVRKKRSQGKE